MILSCAKAESTWANCAKHTFTETFEGIHYVYAQEHEFLNRTSDLYKKIHPQSQTQERLSPSELLMPLHYINQPQSPLWRKECAKPNWENGDLARSGSWGFWRLNKNYFVPYHARQRTQHLDHFDLRYAPHYIFINAVQGPADELKTALRAYRTEISSLVTNPDSARSFKACYEALLPKLEAVQNAWIRFTNSHEVLKEANAIFAKQDHYQSVHDYELWEMQMSKIPYFSTFYQDYLTNAYSRSNHWYQYFFDQGYESVKTAVQRDFPSSHNARLLFAYQRAVSA